ncbi:hypothetical protein TI05_15040 [Achromatium sp. WMS3]|nr:hypothetical protein TI05_15040 [Achromatium sp. WMS3]
MPFLKTAANTIFDQYLEIFKIDYKYFYNNYIESVPLMILAVLMNQNLRDFYLNDNTIKNDLKQFLHYSAISLSVHSLPNQQVFEKNTRDSWEKVCDEPAIVSFLTDYSEVWVNSQASNNGRCNAGNAIGKRFDKLYFRSSSSYHNVKYVKLSDLTYKYHNLKSILQFNGQTDGYWKDLEIASTKVMVLSIPSNTFIRNANKPTEELSANDVNGNFLILDGLVYKSNDAENPIIYMEV